MLSLKKFGTQFNTEPKIIEEKIESNIVERRVGWRYLKVSPYYVILIFAEATNNKIITQQIETVYSPFY